MSEEAAWVPYASSSDRWFHTADAVLAAWASHHIPPEPDARQCRGPLQLQGGSCQGPEVSAHVCFFSAAQRATSTHECGEGRGNPGAALSHYPKLGTSTIVSWFWMLEVQEQGVGRLDSLEASLLSL
jgi:hypothetical protein